MAEKLYPAVHDFLTVCGYTKTAAICLKDLGLDKTKVKTSVSLISIYDSYIKSSKAVVTKKEDSSDDSDGSDSDEDSDEEEKPVPVPAPLKLKLPVAAVVKSKTQDSSSEDDSSEEESDDKSKKVVKAPVVAAITGNKRKAAESSSDEDSDSDSEEEEEKVVAPTKKRKVEVEESDSSEEESEEEEESDEESSDDEEEIAARIKLREDERKRKAVEAAAAAEAWTQRASVSPTPRNGKPKGPRVSGEAFRRVDDEIWSKEILEGLEDNSYAKQFGVDGYGAKASEKLMTVRGKDFRHEKTKKKRGSYRGGAIDTTASNSFKYESS